MAHPSSPTLDAGSPAAGAEEEVFVAPISFPQRRLFILDRIFPGQAAYNVPVALRIRGPLDLDRLTAALADLTARHETLRTAFADGEDGEPVQLISAELAPLVRHFDLRPLAAAGRQAEGARILAEEAVRPFDLARAPLLRTTVVRVDEEEFLLLLNLHHIVMDGASAPVLVGDLFEIYAALGEGREPDLPELAIQYADFAAWQREWLVGEALEQRLAPWRARLADAPVTLALPLDHPRPAVGSGRGGLLPLAIAPEVALPLRERTRAAGATLFMAVLAAYAAFLSRLSGQRDLIVGSPVTGRDRPELEPIIGFFVNSLPLRCRLVGDPGFASFLAAVKAVVIEAFANQDLPFERMVEEVRPERRLDVNPLFQAAFAFQQPREPERRSGDLILAPLALHSGTAKVDLDLHVEEKGEGFGGFWEWSADVFDGVTIARFSAAFARLLAAAVAQPEEPLSRLPLLAPAEAHQLLVEWNDSAAGHPGEATLPALFAARVAAAPDAPAIAEPGRTLTYRELDAASDRLAGHLRDLGLAAEARVGVCLERGAELVVAGLAVLKAGAAYLPLDPDHPAERLALLFEDAGAAALITRSSLAGRLPADRPVLALDADDAGEPPRAGAPPAIFPESLAAVLYVAGSSGRPQGVEVTHRAVIQRVLGTQVSFAATDRVALLPHAGFDGSTLEIWGALVAGACLVPLEREAALAPESLARTLAERRIDALALSPALFHAVVSVEPAAFRPVRDLLLAGDALDPAQAAMVLAAGAPGRLIHAYGPTEATSRSAWQAVTEVPDGAVLLPVGRPLANARLYLLDAGAAPVPIGVTGELFLGGDGLARGYHGDPARTAERFVPDPFAGPGGAGGRLYRSGDLARLTHGGEIDLLGRTDDQVQIRGLRVEPGEVEAALASLPGVAECAVVARRDSAGTLLLVGYFVPRPGAALTPRQLRELLLAKLPEPMVPAVFVPLPALPRTGDGRLDRKALPDPEDQEQAVLTPPPTPVAELVTGIWAEALRVDSIGPGDNFFDLGGHSLTATLVTSQVRATFGVQLPARVLFEAPVLADFATRVDQLLAAAPAAELPPLAPMPRDGEIPLSWAQERIWLVDQRAGGRSPHYNLAGDIAFHGRLDRRALVRALAEVERRQEALRTTFRAGARHAPVQAVHPPAPHPPATVDLSGLAEDRREREARRLAEAEAGRPFALERGALLRHLLLRLGEERHALVFVLHGIVADAWSLTLFHHEVRALYHAFAAGRPSPLPRLTVQGADYALWQRRFLEGAALAPHLAYWRGELAGAPPASDLPFDRPWPPRETFAGRSLRLTLSPAEIGALAELARGHRATLAMVILAGWGVLLARTAGVTDLVIGSPIAQRDRAGIAPLLGCFTNLLALRLKLDGNPGWGEILERAREVTLGAYGHRALPFERLVEELLPERDAARPPLFQSSLAIEDTDASAGPETSLGLVGPGSASELFGLSLQVADPARGGARLSYNPDLFDTATARRLALQLERLLSTLPFTTDLPFTEVPLLAPEEEEELLARAAATAVPAEAFTAVAAAFAARAREQPLAAALVGDGGSISYEELDRRSLRLAHRLAAMGVGAERTVALLLEDPVELATGLLAAAKCGGAVLVLDARLPDGRLAAAFADGPACALVTGTGTAGRLASAVPAQRLDWAEALAEPGSAGAEPLAAPVGPESLAMVAWGTVASGDALVEIRAAALAARCRRLQAQLGLTAGGRFAARPAAAVDLALPLLAALTAGATWGVDGEGAVLPGQPLAEAELAVDPGAPEVAQAPGALLLDALGIPVPVRATGRLWLGGATLAHGYPRAPDRTADAFRPDPAASAPGARRFATGLLARQRNDGGLEVFGLPPATARPGAAQPEEPAIPELAVPEIV